MRFGGSNNSVHVVLEPPDGAARECGGERRKRGSDHAHLDAGHAQFVEGRGVGRGIRHQYVDHVD